MVVNMVITIMMKAKTVPLSLNLLINYALMKAMFTKKDGGLFSFHLIVQALFSPTLLPRRRSLLSLGGDLSHATGCPKKCYIAYWLPQQPDFNASVGFLDQHSKF